MAWAYKNVCFASKINNKLINVEEFMQLLTNNIPVVKVMIKSVMMKM
jgi:hypothetical protein